MTIEEAKAKVIALARQEIGYHEQGSNVVKYNQGDWDDRLYGWNTEGQPWCDIFVDWLFIECFGYGRGSAMTYQFDGCCGAACGSSASYYQVEGAFYQTPEVGDQIFFYADGCIGHTGIVETINGSKITTIEGNYSDSVCRNTFTIGDSKIAGYGRPKWSLAETDEDSDSSDSSDMVTESSEDAPTITIVDAPPEPYTVAEPYEPTTHVCRPGDPQSWFVYAMQYLLKANGYYPEADGVFGIETAKWLLNFQADRNLEEDCQCGELTWAELYKGKNIKITEDGFHVRAMQYLLRAQNYYIETDGIFGPECYKQLNRFQRERDVHEYGCGQKTWSQLVKE